VEVLMRGSKGLMAFLSLLAGPLTLAQVPGLDPEPPKGALWTLEPDGDAIQNDLGFIVVKQWKDFARVGFTSTRDDGASTKAYYISADQKLKMTLWLQLRPDIRGFPLDEEAVWSMMKIGINMEYGLPREKFTKLSEEKFSLGGRTPGGRQQWQRVDTPDGAEVHGAWWQNIGVWGVIVTFSGPEARRADLEAAANTFFELYPFPGAPITTELAVNGKALFDGMRKCGGKPPEGEGKEVTPTFNQATLYALMVPNLQMGQYNEQIISPANRPQDYCVIERFDVAKNLPVTAIQYRGAATDSFEARYAFVMNNGNGGVYQLESMAPEIAKTDVNGVALDQVYLHYTNNKRASLITVFDEWPSYQRLKEVFEKYMKEKPQPIVSTTKTYEKLNIQYNTARIQPVPGEQK
jgi:hypothetical protein